jgi:S-adenosylmethionine-diacylgycerolhomoserine-N-methlytransferase
LIFTDLTRDLKTAAQLALAPIRGGSHGERLEHFYARQRDGYDAFRERLLHGRQELFLELVERGLSGRWLDLGAGTGRNLDFMAPGLSKFSDVCLVDLSPSLLSVAENRIERRGWRNVRVLHADVTDLQTEEPVDLITFSYSLSMIPDWFRAIENAYRLLKPGGVIASVDFFVSRKFPGPARTQHDWWTRTFWPTWFGADGVSVNPEILEFLLWKFERVSLVEAEGKVPFVPLGKMPFYRLVAKKPHSK